MSSLTRSAALGRIRPVSGSFVLIALVAVLARAALCIREANAASPVGATRTSGLGLLRMLESLCSPDAAVLYPISLDFQILSRLSFSLSLARRSRTACTRYA